jgi:hypothetical protein
MLISNNNTFTAKILSLTSNLLKETTESKILSSILLETQTTGFNIEDSLKINTTSSLEGDKIVEKALGESFEKSNNSPIFEDNIFYLGVASISAVLISFLYLLWIVGLCCLCKKDARKTHPGEVNKKGDKRNLKSSKH